MESVHVMLCITFCLEEILVQGGIVSGRGDRWCCRLQVFRYHRDRKCDFVHANTFNIKSGLHSKL